MRALTVMGLFRDDVAGVRVEWDHHPWASFVIGKDCHNRLFVEPIQQTLELVAHRTPTNGLYHYFKCPDCPTKRLALYVDPSSRRLRCRRCLAVGYESSAASRSPFRETTVRYRNMLHPPRRPKGGWKAYSLRLERARRAKEEAVGRWANRMLRRAWGFENGQSP
jgi:hypothetical protein